MPTCRQYGRVVLGLVGEMKPPNTGQLFLGRRGSFASCVRSFFFRRTRSPGFLSFFCGLFLSFARKKEKPRSWLSSDGSGSGKRWLLLTQQATKVKTKEKPRSGLNPTAAVQDKVDAADAAGREVMTKEKLRPGSSSGAAVQEKGGCC